MNRLVLGLTLVIWTISASGCGLLVVGAMAGGAALKRNSARKEAFQQMKKENSAAEIAMKKGDAQTALKHYHQAQKALYAYTFKYEGKAKLSALAAEHQEIARTARGLVVVHEARKDETSAAAVASEMMPTGEAESVLKRTKVIKIAPEVVATAPHMYQGMRTQWHGEVSFARHDPSTDTTRMLVIPYTFERRQVGLRNERYYDHQLKIYRDRLVPSYRTFKVQLRNKAFQVELKGYNELLIPGSAGTFIGQVEAAPDGVVLKDAVPTAISSRPGAKTIWFLGVQLPQA